MKKTKFNPQNWKVVSKGKIYWLASKRHSGSHICYLKIINSVGEKLILKPVGPFKFMGKTAKYEVIQSDYQDKWDRYVKSKQYKKDGKAFRKAEKELTKEDYARNGLRKQG